MASVRTLLRWVFVRGPVAFFRLGESESWLFTPILLGGMAGAAGVGAGIGALAGAVAGIPVSDAAFTGVMIGFVVLMAWFVLSILVIVVLWFRGITPAEAAVGAKPVPGSPATSDGWRRPGQALIPASAVGFFVLMTVAFGALAAHSWYGSRSWDEPTALVDGSVVAVHKPSVFSKGSGKVDVRYTVGGQEHTIKIGADPGDRFLRMGDALPVEYSTGDPNRARAVWAVESSRSDVTFWGISAALCGVLGIATGVGYLVGPRQRGKH
jgi:hypothetical protein